MFDVSSTSGGGTDSSNITRIFRVEESNGETYFVVQVNYTLSISTVYRPTAKSVWLLCKHHDHDSFNQASLRERLELGYFACREVNVSFATVSTHGISAFSPATEVAVHGGEMIHSVV